VKTITASAANRLGKFLTRDFRCIFGPALRNGSDFSTSGSSPITNPNLDAGTAPVAIEQRDLAIDAILVDCELTDLPCDYSPLIGPCTGKRL
jgi:hypothetical protein